jgi:DNA-binding MarR family transcriptional regulator
MKTHRQSMALDDVLEFMGVIWAIDHEMERVSKRMESTIGLTIPQRMSLLLIERHPGMLASHLASVLHLHRGTVTGVVHRLVAAGYVVRTADAADARRSGLRLTAAGRRINSQHTGTFEGAVRRVLMAVPSRDLSAAVRVLSTLADELRAVAGVRRVSNARRPANPGLACV